MALKVDATPEHDATSMLASLRAALEVDSSGAKRRVPAGCGEGSATLPSSPHRETDTWAFQQTAMRDDEVHVQVPGAKEPLPGSVANNSCTPTLDRGQVLSPRTVDAKRQATLKLALLRSALEKDARGRSRSPRNIKLKRRVPSGGGERSATSPPSSPRKETVTWAFLRAGMRDDEVRWRRPEAKDTLPGSVANSSTLPSSRRTGTDNWTSLLACFRADKTRCQAPAPRSAEAKQQAAPELTSLRSALEVDARCQSRSPRNIKLKRRVPAGDGERSATLPPSSPKRTGICSLPQATEGPRRSPLLNCRVSNATETLPAGVANGSSPASSPRGERDTREDLLAGFREDKDLHQALSLCVAAAKQQLPATDAEVSSSTSRCEETDTSALSGGGGGGDAAPLWLPEVRRHVPSRGADSSRLSVEVDARGRPRSPRNSKAQRRVPAGGTEISATSPSSSHGVETDSWESMLAGFRKDKNRCRAPSPCDAEAKQQVPATDVEQAAIFMFLRTALWDGDTCLSPSPTVPEAKMTLPSSVPCDTSTPPSLPHVERDTWKSLLAGFRNDKAPSPCAAEAKQQAPAKDVEDTATLTFPPTALRCGDRCLSPSPQAPELKLALPSSAHCDISTSPSAPRVETNTWKSLLASLRNDNSPSPCAAEAKQQVPAKNADDTAPSTFLLSASPQVPELKLTLLSKAHSDIATQPSSPRVEAHTRESLLGGFREDKDLCRALRDGDRCQSPSPPVIEVKETSPASVANGCSTPPPPSPPRVEGDTWESLLAGFRQDKDRCQATAGSFSTPPSPPCKEHSRQSPSPRGLAQWRATSGGGGDVPAPPKSPELRRRLSTPPLPRGAFVSDLSDLAGASTCAPSTTRSGGSIFTEERSPSPESTTPQAEAGLVRCLFPSTTCPARGTPSPGGRAAQIKIPAQADKAKVAFNLLPAFEEGIHVDSPKNGYLDLLEKIILGSS